MNLIVSLAVTLYSSFMLPTFIHSFFNSRAKNENKEKFHNRKNIKHKNFVRNLKKLPKESCKKFLGGCFVTPRTIVLSLQYVLDPFCFFFPNFSLLH